MRCGCRSVRLNDSPRTSILNFIWKDSSGIGYCTVCGNRPTDASRPSNFQRASSSVTQCALRQIFQLGYMTLPCAHLIVKVRNKMIPKAVHCKGDKVYIRDSQHEWLPATVLEADLNEARVRIDLPSDLMEPSTVGEEKRLHGKELTVSLLQYRDRQLPLQNNSIVRDMAELPYLHEAAVLYQIKARHLALKPYTRVGEVIVAMNPCQWIEHLYSEQNQELYSKNFVWQSTYNLIIM